MKAVKLSLAAVAAGALSAAVAAELVVDPKGGEGTYPTIQKAVDAAKGGDVVLIKGGVYRENVTISKDYGEAPLTVRAASGERVVLSGFEDITDWKDMGGGLYSAHVDKKLGDLYVGLVQQQCGRWPDDGTLRLVTTVDMEKRVFKTDSPADAPFLEEIAKDPKDAVVFYYFAFGNSYGSPRLGSYDFKTGDISFDEKNWNRWLKPDRNRYSFMNHPALVRRPGDWAFVRDDRNDKRNQGGTVWFRPKSKDDLKKARYRAISRPMVLVGHWKDRVAGLVIDGLEIEGGASDAIKISADDVTVRNCLVHNNAGLGIGARGVKNNKVLSNLVVANGNGVSVVSARDSLVEGNEIAYSLVDGLTVAGNIGNQKGEKGKALESYNVTVRRNYLHHHILQAHPDNFQMYRGVNDTVIEENFNIWGGQSIMTEEVEGVKFRNNVFMGCDATMVICGHGNSHHWKIENNTLFGAGWGFFSFTGKDYEVKRNLLIGGSIGYDSADHEVRASENFFSPKYEGLTARPWKGYSSLEKALAEIGQEEGSREGEVKMANFPATFGVGSANGAEKDCILVRKCPADTFLAGDKIEINGDGKLRTVKSFAAHDERHFVLAFEPALPAVPFRGVLVFNWKQAKSVVVDTSLPADSPVMEGGKQAYGSTIDVRAFANGDLLGKGARTIPALPPEVAAALPDPNDVVVPLEGH